MPLTACAEDRLSVKIKMYILCVQILDKELTAFVKFSIFSVREVK